MVFLAGTSLQWILVFKINVLILAKTSAMNDATFYINNGVIFQGKVIKRVRAEA